MRPRTLHDDAAPGKAYDARLVRRLLPSFVPQAPLIAASLGLLFVALGANLLQPYLIKLLIDEHILPGEPRGLGLLALAYLAAFLVELLARYGQIYTMERTGQNLILALRIRLFAHLQRLDSAFFDRNPVGRLMTRVTTDIESLADLFASGVVSLLGDTVKLLAIVGILWWLEPRLALVTLTVVPVLFLLSYWFRGRIRLLYREVRRRIARINAFLQEAISGMLLIQLFRRQRLNREEFEAINRGHRDAELRSVVYESSFSAIVELVGSLAIALILWYGGGGIVRGALTFGTLVAFLEYTQRFFGPVHELSSLYAVMQAAMAALERIYALLDERPSITSPARPAPAPATRGRIEFERVRFAYRPGEEAVRGVSFRVEPGEKVAVVGATGAGKSTLAKLLIRLYDPTGGRILLDGRDLRSLPIGHLRRRVGVVMQDHVLVSGTLHDNIAFGDRTLPPGRVREAARLVHADEFIRRLPGGYSEPVRERGDNLSLGQKQLISFARAVAYDPAVLILDEATSSVDTETERRIQDALRKLLEGRTSLIIAHRLSTLIGCDRILVLHHGRLVEEGDHGGLLARRGIYHRLYRLQFGLAGARGTGTGPDGDEPPQTRTLRR
ncbi:MAG: ABC transporter ATP-binding protein [Acidobacteriota bacterium]